MKANCLAAFAMLLIPGSIAWGQQPTLRMPDSSGQRVARLQAPVAIPAADQFTPPNLSLPSVTPEMWLYSQEWRRRDDPAQSVRRKAEARTDARMQRIAAMKWYGFSNARPQAAVTPMMGVYSPAWIGNGFDRYDWVGGYGPSTILVAENPLIVR